MATKKAASPKKAASAQPAAKKQSTTTKTTTVKAVEARPSYKAAAASNAVWKRVASAPFISAVVAEFIGTFLLAAVILSASQQGVQPILVLFGIAGIYLIVAPISGGYVNPALAIAAWTTRRLDGVRAIAYIIAQVLGAMLALVLLNSFIQASGSDQSSTMSATPTLFKVADLVAGKEWFVFAAELIGTAIFGFAFAAATRQLERVTSGLIVGFGLYIALLVGGSLAALAGGATAVLNPAVAVSLQAFQHLSGVWPYAIYGLGSILGAVVGFFLYDYLKGAQKDVA